MAILKARVRVDAVAIRLWMEDFGDRRLATVSASVVQALLGVELFH
jgi:hypothetical protein